MAQENAPLEYLLGVLDSLCRGGTRVSGKIQLLIGLSNYD